MKNLKKIALTLGLATLAILAASLNGKQQLFPSSEFIIERQAYSLSYSGQHKQARWVYEYLTPESVQGKEKREKISFKEDPALPEVIRSKDHDYLDSNFDRGHLCPAADARSSEQAMYETFYLSNISPQVPQFNRGYWARLERHVRDLTKTYKALHVYTGPLYLPHEESDGKRYVKYQVIGKNNVAVPTHFFKVIFDSLDRSPIEAYILPNETISKDHPLTAFSATLEKIEAISGIVFRKNK
jgi:endonuclease G